MIVLDASAAIDLLLRIEPNAASIAARIGRSRESLHAPSLIDVEVLHALRRYTLTGELPASASREVLQDLLAARITRYPFVSLLERMWELRANISAFDAAYVALADALKAPLLTCDRKLARTKGHGASIELVGRP